MVLIAVGVFAVVVAVWLVPLGLIWAVNVLFGLGIGFTLETWAAALLLVLIYGVKGR